MKMSLLDLSLAEFETEVEILGEPKYRAGQVWQWVCRKRAVSFDAMTDLPAALRETLTGRYEILRLDVLRDRIGSDGTRKWLYGLKDGLSIETVLMPDVRRDTLCVSSQVGCAFGCVFCRTARMSLHRNLAPGEIVSQVITSMDVAQIPVERLNIVFMGMGEPTDNLDSVRKAVEALTHRHGLGMSPKRITISTVGVIPALEELAALRVNVAVSLNAVRDDLRDKLMPVNKKYALAELLMATRSLRTRMKGELTFEYVLMKDINDSMLDARTLAEIALQTGAKVNLIPFNPALELPFRRPSEEDVARFRAEMGRHGLRAWVRRTRGLEIAAACGQLAVEEAGLPVAAAR